MRQMLKNTSDFVTEVFFLASDDSAGFFEQLDALLLALPPGDEEGRGASVGRLVHHRACAQQQPHAGLMAFLRGDEERRGTNVLRLVHHSARAQ